MAGACVNQLYNDKINLHTFDQGRWGEGGSESVNSDSPPYILLILAVGRHFENKKEGFLYEFFVLIDLLLVSFMQFYTEKGKAFK